MAMSEATLAVRLPKELADELDELARDTGRSKSYYARQAIIEFLEDRADYLHAIAALEDGASRASPTSPSSRSSTSLAWTIEFRPERPSELRRLDGQVQRRIVRFLEQRVIAVGDPRQLGKPLDGDKGDLWSYRIGDYRVDLDYRGSSPCGGRGLGRPSPRSLPPVGGWPVAGWKT